LSALAAVLLLAGARTAAAGDATSEGDGLGGLWSAVRKAVELAVAERSRRPPVPVAVTWRERRIA
jgi:hypothetical protein